MQNKGIVIVTAVLLTLASIFYLSFSAATSQTLRSDEHRQENTPLHLTLSGVVAPAPHPLLSGVHIALYAAFVPLHAHLFRICSPGTPEAWTH